MTKLSELLIQADLYLAGIKIPNIKLEDLEVRVLRLRMKNKLNFGEIGQKINKSRQRAHQLFNIAIFKITGTHREKVTKHQKPYITALEESFLPEDKEENKIINYVARRFNLQTKFLFDDSRIAKFVLPRQTVMYLLRKKLSLPWIKIAKVFKRTDHTTVMHAYDKIDNLIKSGKLII